MTKRKRGGFPLPLVFFKEFLFYILKAHDLLRGGSIFFFGGKIRRKGKGGTLWREEFAKEGGPERKRTKPDNADQ